MEWCGIGLGMVGIVMLVVVIVGSGCIVSLYVNSFNMVVCVVYVWVGFKEIGMFVMVLLD